MPGFILWEGVSQLDGETPVVAIAITSSSNRKTGDMLQTYILRADDVHPAEAVRNGQDSAICGSCPLRSGAGCYVDPRGYSGVWKAYKRGRYSHGDPAAIGNGRMVRLGTYGDPAAIPLHVWEELLSQASGHTGYTHQWKRFPAFRSVTMASADSRALAIEAQAAGWRTYRIADIPAAGEIACPSSRGVRCEDCRLCDGSGPAKSITIAAHGFREKKARATLAA